MTIDLEFAVSQYYSVASAATVSRNFTSAVPAGALIHVAMASINQVNSDVVVTDTQGNVYHKNPPATGGIAGISVISYYCPNCNALTTADVLSMTPSVGSEPFFMVAVYATGVNARDIASNGTFGDGNSQPNTGTISSGGLVSSAELLLGHNLFYQGAPVSDDPGFAYFANNDPNPFFHVGYVIVASNAAVPYSATIAPFLSDASLSLHLVSYYENSTPPASARRGTVKMF